MSLDDSLDELQSKSEQLAQAPQPDANALLNSRTNELEQGLDQLQTKSTNPVPQVDAVTQPGALPALESNASVDLTPSAENTALAENVQLHEVNDGTPQAPAATWDQISASGSFKNASPADKFKVAVKYAGDIRDWQQSQTGADANAIDSRLNQWMQDRHNESFPVDAKTIHPSWWHQLVTNAWYGGKESNRPENFTPGQKAQAAVDEEFHNTPLEKWGELEAQGKQPSWSNDFRGERAPFALPIARTLDAVASKFTGDETLTKLTEASTREANAGETSFTNLGIPRPFGIQKSIPGKFAAAVGNLPVDILNFAAAPGATASKAFSLIEEAPALIQRAVALGFTGQMLHDAIQPGIDLQDRISLGIGAALGAHGVVKAPEIVKAARSVVDTLRSQIDAADYKQKGMPMASQASAEASSASAAATKTQLNAIRNDFQEKHAAIKEAAAKKNGAEVAGTPEAVKLSEQQPTPVKEGKATTSTPGTGLAEQSTETRTGSANGEKVVGPALVDKDGGVIAQGKFAQNETHEHVLENTFDNPETFDKAHGVFGKDYEAGTQGGHGFVVEDSKGNVRIVDRKEAAQIGVKAGQVKPGLERANSEDFIEEQPKKRGEQNGNSEARQSKDQPETSPVSEAAGKVKTAKSAEAPTPKLEEVAHSTARDLNKRIKVPKGATFVRVTDAKGRVSHVSVRDLSGSNPFHEAGPFKKVEAGTMAKGNKFSPMTEPITVRPTEPTKLKNALAEAPLGSVMEDEDAAHTGRSTFDETEKSNGTKTEAEETEPKQSDISTSDQAWQKATHDGVAEALRAKGIDPKSVGWDEDAATRVAATVNKAHHAFDANPQEFLEKARDRVQSQLLRNTEETGSPLKVRKENGEVVDYNPYLTAKSAISNAHEKIGANEAKGESADTAIENAKASTEADQSAEGEHPQADTIHKTVARAFSAFAKRIDLPLDAAPDATRAQILRAAKVVYDQMIEERTGHKLEIGDSASLVGKPGAVNKLVADAAFRDAVFKRINDRIRQDLRAAVPKDREILLNRDEIKMGFEKAITDAKLEQAAERVKNGTPLADVMGDLPAKVTDRVKALSESLNTSKGINSVMESIAKTGTDMQKALAQVLAKVGSNARVVLDPLLHLTDGASGLYDQGGVLSKRATIKASPLLNDTAIRDTLIHEKAHDVLMTKTSDYIRGSHDRLSAADLHSFDELEKLRQFALQHESVPNSIRKAADIKNMEERQTAFDEAASREHYGLLDLHEFMAESVSNKAFQRFLNELPTDTLPELNQLPAGGTLWDRVKSMLRTLILGDHPVTENSVLARAFDHTIDLLKSDSLENQRKLNVERPADFKSDQQRQTEFLHEFATEHGFDNMNDMVVNEPDLFNEASNIYREGIHTPAAEVPHMPAAAADADVQNETVDRAHELFDDIGKLKKGLNAEEVLRDAMNNGANTPDAFAEAFKEAGLDPELAEAVGTAIDSHFRLTGVEKAGEIRAENEKAAQVREQTIHSPLETLGKSLGVVQERPAFERLAKDFEGEVTEAQKLGAVSPSPFAITTLQAVAKNLYRDFASKNIGPFQRLTRKWTGDLQQTFYRVRKIADEINKRVPDEAAREGITNWIQANGDAKILQERANASTDAKLKAGYEAALKLTSDQVKVAEGIKTFYDDYLKAGKSADLLNEGRDNYVNQIWEDPRGALVRFATGKKLVTDFKFAKKATHASFFEGEQAGLKPISKDITKLMQVYANEFGKVLASRDFIKNLTEATASDGRALVTVSGSAQKIKVGPNDPTNPLGWDESKMFLVRPRTRPGDALDYRALANNPAFSKWKWVAAEGAAEGAKNILLKGDLLIHPEVFTHLENVFGTSAIRRWYNSQTSPLASVPKFAVKTLDRISGGTKDIMLSVLSPFHYVQEGTHAVGHRVNPFWGLDKLDLDSPATLDSVRHGLVLAHDEHLNLFAEGLSAGPLSQRIPGLGKYVVKPMSEHLFKSYIPRLKLTTYNKALARNLDVFADDLKAGKMDETDVKAMTADQINAAYGHLNYEALGRDPTIQHLSRMLLLAPDFLEARGRFAAQAARGLVDKGGREQLVALAFLAAGQWTAARVFNKTLDDDYHFDRPFSVLHNGKEYTMRSVPEDLYRAWGDTRQFIYGRLNPIIGRGMVQYATGRNYRGEKVTWTDTTKELATQWIPIWMRSLPGVKELSETEKNKTVSAWDTFLSSSGLQVKGFSPINEVYKLSENYKKSVGIKEDTGAYPISKYQQLRYALEHGDHETAQSEFDKLKAASPKNHPVSKLVEGFHASLFHHFTGKDQATETAFKKSLQGHDKDVYDAGVAKRKDVWKNFQQLKKSKPEA